jgi:hypothetical protein
MPKTQINYDSFMGTTIGKWIKKNKPKIYSYNIVTGGN